MKIGKKFLFLGTLGCGIIGLGLNYKSKHPSKYSYQWISKLTDAEWEIEREHVRKDIFCNPKLSMKVKEEAHRLLDLFDKVWRDKHYIGEIGFLAYREHGWYISKD